jgi:hypothetical protein
LSKQRSFDVGHLFLKILVKKNQIHFTGLENFSKIRLYAAKGDPNILWHIKHQFNLPAYLLLQYQAKTVLLCRSDKAPLHLGSNLRREIRFEIRAASDRQLRALFLPQLKK